MKSFSIKRILSAVLALSFAMLALSGCGLFSTRLSYMFKPEPTLPETNEPKQVTSNRLEAYNSYGYESLSDEMKTAYNTLDKYINLDYSEGFTVYGDNEDDFLNVLEAYEIDHPEVFWLDASTRYSYIEGEGSYQVFLTFTLEGDKLKKAKQNLEAKVGGILNDMPESATDYELELYINDYLIDNCEYDKKNAQRHNAYGALVDGKAVCDGYSKAFQLLCNRIGLECVGIEGTAVDFNVANGESSDGHMWNCVKIGGEWYHVDVTWNDSGDHIQHYLYLNLTTEEIANDHTISPLYGGEDSDDYDFLNVFVPECNATQYNFFNHDCVTLKDLNDDDEVIAAIIKAARNGEEYVHIYIDESLDYDEVDRAIEDRYGYTWFDAANYYNNDNPKISPVGTYYTYDTIRAVTFELEYE